MEKDKNHEFGKLIRLLYLPISDIEFSNSDVQLFYKKQSLGFVTFSYVEVGGKLVTNYLLDTATKNKLKWEIVYIDNQGTINNKLSLELGHAPTSITLAPFRKLYYTDGDAKTKVAECFFEHNDWRIHLE